MQFYQIMVPMIIHKANRLDDITNKAVLTINTALFLQSMNIRPIDKVKGHKSSCTEPFYDLRGSKPLSWTKHGLKSNKD